VPTTAGHIRAPTDLGDAVMSAAVDSVPGAAARAPQSRSQESRTFWRSLLYFNTYRLVAALALLVMATTWSSALPFGSRDYAKRAF